MVYEHSTRRAGAQPGFQKKGVGVRRIPLYVSGRPRHHDNGPVRPSESSSSQESSLHFSTRPSSPVRRSLPSYRLRQGHHPLTPGARFERPIPGSAAGYPVRARGGIASPLTPIPYQRIAAVPSFPLPSWVRRLSPVGLCAVLVRTRPCRWLGCRVGKPGALPLTPATKIGVLSP